MIRASLAPTVPVAVTHAAAGPAELGPFELDEHTLLLAHYDDGIDAHPGSGTSGRACAWRWAGSRA